MPKHSLKYKVMRGGLRSHINDDYIVFPRDTGQHGGWGRGGLTSASEPKVTECAVFVMICGSTLPPACTGSCTMKVDPTPAPFIHSHFFTDASFLTALMQSCFACLHGV